MTDHTRTKKIGGDSIFIFVVNQVVAGNRYDKLVKNDLVIGLPKLSFDKDKICNACQFGKQVRNSFKSKNLVSISRPLELLHVDLFGLMDVLSMGGKS